MSNFMFTDIQDAYRAKRFMRQEKVQDRIDNATEQARVEAGIKSVEAEMLTAEAKIEMAKFSGEQVKQMAASLQEDAKEAERNRYRNLVQNAKADNLIDEAQAKMKLQSLYTAEELQWLGIN